MADPPFKEWWEEFWQSGGWRSFGKGGGGGVLGGGKGWWVGRIKVKIFVWFYPQKCKTMNHKELE